MSKTEKISAAEYQQRLKDGTLETSSKYGNKRITWGGETFDSKWEWTHFLQLLAREESEQIRDLQRQVTIELQPAFNRNGETVKAIKYIADFVYSELDNGTWHRVIEDAKGHQTVVFRLKWKMLKFIMKNEPDVRLKLVFEKDKGS